MRTSYSRASRVPFLPLFFFLAACASTPGIRAPNGIAVLEEVTLGGSRQWLLIRGRDAANPLLLYLHGGPGLPGIPFEHALRALEEKFTVVMWDQRGAGKSYHENIPRESMTIGRFCDDAHELVRMLLKRFRQDRLYLAGHSWGSVLGALTAARHPELFYAYIGIGQVANMVENERLSYDFVVAEARARRHEEAERELSRLLPPYRGRTDDLAIQRKWLARFGGVMFGESNYDKLTAIALRSPEYTLGDLLRIDAGSRFTTDCLWDELLTIDLPRQAPRLEVPVYFITGRHDFNTPFELTVKYFEVLEAPKGKTLLWFEKSAHIIILEEPDKFVEVLTVQILPETYRPRQ